MFFCLLFFTNKAFCFLSPEGILVVANMNARQSVSLAMYYINKRNIPMDNFLKIWCNDSERISREDYSKKIKISIQIKKMSRSGKKFFVQYLRSSFKSTNFLKQYVFSDKIYE